MSAGTAPARPARAVTWLAVRQIRRGAVIMVLLSAGMTAFVAGTFDTVTADPAARQGLQRIAASPAIRTVFGEPGTLEHAGGFTVWRLGTVLAVLLGVWVALAVTRITRGAEEAGRWDLLLAGLLRRPAVIVRHTTVVAVAAVATGAAVTAALAATASRPAGALVHGAGLALTGLFAAAVAALCAQLFPARSAASGTAVGVLAAGLVVRMVADSAAALSWLRWASPFGLLELSRPYAGDRVLPLAVLLLWVAVAGALAVVAAGRRDTGEALITGRKRRRVPRRLLGGVGVFALHRLCAPLLVWCAGVAAYFLLIGLTAVSVTEFVREDSGIGDLAGQAGFTGLGQLEGFTAVLFSLLALPAAGFAAARMNAYAAAESDRRLTLLASRPVSRMRLLGTEAAVIAAGILVLVSVAAVALWAGVAVAGGGLSLLAAMGGAWNVVPIALLGLATAVAAVGWAPRLVTHLGSLPATGGFLWLVLADSTDAPGWVRALTPFAHLAPVPASGANVTATVVMLVVAALLGAAGAAGYRRRDLAG